MDPVHGEQLTRGSILAQPEIGLRVEACAIARASSACSRGRGLEGLNAPFPDALVLSSEASQGTQINLAQLPAPGTLALFGLGLAGLAGLAAARRRKAAA